MLSFLQTYILRVYIYAHSLAEIGSLHKLYFEKHCIINIITSKSIVNEFILMYAVAKSIGHLKLLN